MTIDYQQIIDISPVVSERIGVFPGDQKYSRKVVMDCDNGDHISLSSITTTVHLGAHADAPNHYKKNSTGVEKQDLGFYLGEAQVIDTHSCSSDYIGVDDLKTKEITGKRVLIKTNSFPDPDNWNSDFKGLAPELIDFLAQQGVITVGVDTPSLDVETSKELPSHAMVAKHDMAILEGLVLTHVEEGSYFLSALPLSLENCDASPVRAVLLK